MMIAYLSYIFYGLRPTGYNIITTSSDWLTYIIIIIICLFAKLWLSLLVCSTENGLGERAYLYNHRNCVYCRDLNAVDNERTHTRYPRPTIVNLDAVKNIYFKASFTNCNNITTTMYHGRVRYAVVIRF